MRRKEGIILSMTPLERRKPDLIKATRKRRIANGAGVHVQEVNRMLNEFEQMQGHDEKNERRRDDEDDEKDGRHEGHAENAVLTPSECSLSGFCLSNHYLHAILGSSRRIYCLNSY